MADTSDFTARRLQERAQELRKLRTTAGVTITELSKRTSLSEQTIQRIESGERSWLTTTEDIYREGVQRLYEEKMSKL